MAIRRLVHDGKMPLETKAYNCDFAIGETGILWRALAVGGGEVFGEWMMKRSDGCWMAEILRCDDLGSSDPGRVVNHVELSIEESNLQFIPGDAAVVWGTNWDAVVDDVLAATSLSAADIVTIDGCERRLGDALREDCELINLDGETVLDWLKASASPVFAEFAKNQDGLTAWMSRNEFADLAKLASRPVGAQQLVDLLPPMQPRYYSVASSLKAHPGSVHLLASTDKRIDHVTMDKRRSVMPPWLEEEGTVPLGIVSIDVLRLPAPDLPVIMFANGTGVAPFRAFLQERAAMGATGPNWLFFGNPMRDSDFFYSDEWESLGLTHLSTAFSRDQARKIYVQDRLRENAAEVADWLRQGAHVYVCGSVDMGAAVERLFASILASAGLESTDELKSAGRYAAALF
jgi:sulfite reductase (NADPH) flavoprotein alpha-component